MEQHFVGLFQLQFISSSPASRKMMFVPGQIPGQTPKQLKWRRFGTYFSHFNLLRNDVFLACIN